MELRQRTVAGAGAIATASVEAWLASLGLSRPWLLLILAICIVIIVALTKRAARHLSWNEIEARFASLGERDTEPEYEAGQLRAEHVREPDGTWRWYVDGGKADLRREAERLCAIAGQRLARKTLSLRVARAHDDFSRWLYFLIDIGEGDNEKSVTVDSASLFKSLSGDTITTYPYSIPSLVQACRNGCLEREHARSGGVA